MDSIWARGAIYLFCGQKLTTNDARVLRAIGPVWDGNEVWLIAAGGTLYFCFSSTLRLELQRVLPSADDGSVAAHSARHWYRIPRSHRKPGVAGFLRRDLQYLQHSAGGVFWGALGNVVRGVPLDATGYFFEPLWTNFKLSAHPGILDWLHGAHGRDGAGDTDRAWFLTTWHSRPTRIWADAPAA